MGPHQHHPGAFPLHELRYEPQQNEAAQCFEPPKNINGGMWYSFAPKIGSVFRRAKQQLFKDTLRMCPSYTSPTECVESKTVPHSMFLRKVSCREGWCSARSLCFYIHSLPAAFSSTSTSVLPILRDELFSAGRIRLRGLANPAQCWRVPVFRSSSDRGRPYVQWCSGREFQCSSSMFEAIKCSQGHCCGTLHRWREENVRQMGL